MIITPGSNPVYVGNPSLPLSFSAPQLKDFDVYATRNPATPCGASICLSWFPVSGAAISEYRVYRSIIGFMGNIASPSTIDGKTLELSINLGPTQTVTFNSGTTVVDRINASLFGAYAVSSKADISKFLFRVDGGSEPGVVQILGGTALADLGLTAGTFSKESHDTQITTVPASPNDDTDGVEWCDPDGTLYDSYAVTTVDLSGVESGKTDYQTPTETTGKLCVVYGCISDLSGVRAPDVTLVAKILQYPQSVVPPSFINKEEITAITDGRGKFEIYLLQGALVDISSENIYYRRTIRVPDQPRVALTDLLVDRDYRCPLETY